MNTGPLQFPLVGRLCDDAAVFPPGNSTLEQALSAHLKQRRSAHRDLVDPLVLAFTHLDRLPGLVAVWPARSFTLAVTTPLAQLRQAMITARAIPAAQLVSLEIGLPDEIAADDLVPAVEAAVEGHTGVTVYIEVPRDARRDALLRALAGTGRLAKFLTGGVRAELYPDESELAASVLAAVRAEVPFKATAGMHHALRNTDPQTGFEQHGFLNLLTATGAASEGADEAVLTELLADRDGARVAERMRALPATVRESFRSFGSCSIADPVVELADLGLIPPDLTRDLL
ncbi:hypothetical protein AB0I54_46090 [Streptomyces sp. NPDC050625]|uniref:hypothetical protein n=1 Tax=Streptomyces sp. NPDC050625 TaxID=3154629 RepID=UPI003445DEA3